MIHDVTDHAGNRWIYIDDCWCDTDHCATPSRNRYWNHGCRCCLCKALVAEYRSRHRRQRDARAPR